MWINLVLVALAFGGMEALAWASHKYIMHGFLWSWHRDHHQSNAGFWQRNDRFFLLYALPGCALLLAGWPPETNWMFFVGVGITAYGFTYFILHDVFIHRRFSWFGRIKNPYLSAIRKAHYVHHKHLDPKEGECFGLLIVPIRYLREAYRSR